MGLFSKKRDSSPDSGAGTTVPHAAYDAADVEDARRGRPAESLEAFAQAAGLAFRGSEQAGTFLSTLPIWPDYLFNVCRGTTVGGRLGQIGHELGELRAHNGDVYPDGLHALKPKRVGPFVEVGGIVVNEKNEPFGSNAVWLPTTTAHVRAPETARLPVVRITRLTPTADRTLTSHLERLGLPGYWVLEGDQDEALLGAIVDAVRPWLAARSDVHVNLRVRYGVVAVTVSGYRADHDDLRQLLDGADGIAGALSALLPGPSGAPFGEAGPDAGTVPPPPGAVQPGSNVVAALAELSRQLGMYNEDISHLLSLFPRCPIPGIPTGVLLGTLPGLAAPSRIVWNQHGGHTDATFRGGAVMEARIGAATPLGGVLNSETGMYVEVVDGLVACWAQRRSVGGLESADLLARASATLRASGLAVD